VAVPVKTAAPAYEDLHMVQAITPVTPPPAEEPQEQGAAPGEPKNEANPRIWSYPVGFKVMTCGFLMPSILILGILLGHHDELIRLLFKHPLETLVEALFAVLVPISNRRVWITYLQQERGGLIQATLLNGAACGTAGVVALVSLSLLAVNFTWSPAVVSAIALGSVSTSIYLSVKLRELSETRLSRDRKLQYAVCGAALSVLAFVAAEAKGAIIRINEYQAIVGRQKEQEQALNRLRQMADSPLLAWLTCEQDMRMQCADAGAVGLPGLFIKMSPRKEQELYFKVTGKPYGNSFTDSVYAMPDAYLRKNVVGEVSPSLSLIRSAITGNLHSSTLSGTVEWTMVLKNTSTTGQEARAEIAVPPQACVSGLTMWARGKAIKAGFGGFGGSYNWSPVSGVSPASVVDLGRNRVLLKCSAVPPEGELKVNVTVTERATAETSANQSYTLPQLIAANFSLDGQHELRLHSDAQPTLALDGINISPVGDGVFLSQGALDEKQLHGAPIVVQMQNASAGNAVALEDKLSGQGGYLIQHLEVTHSAPLDQVVVVLDGSQSMKAELPKIQKALASMPASVKASVIFANGNDKLAAEPLKSALPKLQNTDAFSGGQDNLEAVTRAAGIAGETKHGAVLWIHGPQPSINEELYIMTPYLSKPRFFELALDNSTTDTGEFFRNYQEIGPFTAVPRSNDVGKDLTACLARWQPNALEYHAALEHKNELPAAAKLLAGPEANEIALLYGRENSYEMLRNDSVQMATALAGRLGIVTPVTSAEVSAQEVSKAYKDSTGDPVQAAQMQAALNGDNRDHNDNWLANLDPRRAMQSTLSQSFSTVVSQTNALNNYSANGVSLAGAANGTIGPQGADATVITGVNTAGTVRVNNLANLEALLNIVANLGEIIGLLYGLYLLIRGLCGMGAFKMSPIQTVWAGCLLAGAGLCLPGCINWLVASSRVANLFS
jgi:hypothetical protein